MSCKNYKSYLNEDCVREVNKHFVVELQQRVNLIEKNMIVDRTITWFFVGQEYSRIALV